MELNSYIDHTLLAPDATQADIDRVTQEALDNHFCSVMVNPYWVSHVHQKLAGSGVKTDCVIGFPLGATSTRAKVAEAEIALYDGADELDMVMNIGEFKAGHYDQVAADMKLVIDTIHHQGKVAKVIIETCLLTDDEITKAAQMVVQAGADFVKTSTGFSKAGATVHAVKLMSAAVAGSRTKVKASGGIHTKEEAEAMIAAGASRLGVSHSMAIIGKK